MTGPALVGPHLQRFFTDHLITQRRLNPETIASYRDTFRLLLQFVHRETGVEPAFLSIPELNVDRILDFLDSLEKERNNTIASGNLRLTAIRSFYRMVALRDPASGGRNTGTRDSTQAGGHQSALVLNARRNGRYPCSVGPKPMVRSTKLCLASHDVQHGCSCLRNILSSAESGALWNEELRSAAWQREEGALNPLWPRTARILKEWLREIGPRDGAVVFPNVRGEPLSRFAIHLLLRKAAHQAAVHYVSLKRKRVSPHVVRHGTAMALLQSGVDIAVIALWLGHESIETTNAYVHANLAMKEKALAKVQPMDTPFRRFHADDRLLAFLESI